MIAMKQLLDRTLDKFTIWFASSVGVWQTFIFCMAMTIVELIFPHLDPNNLAFLFGMTLYSCFTQPALAYVGNRSSDKSDEVMGRVQVLLEKIESMDDRILTIEEAILLAVEHIKDDSISVINVDDESTKR